MKRRWLMAPVVAGILALAIIGGTALGALAQTGTSGTTSSFVARVASILGLDAAKVQDAMNQAGQQMQDEALKARLDNSVKQGKMTQEQADEYYKWYQSRPKGLGHGSFGGRGFGKGPHFGGRGWGGPGFHGPAPQSPSTGTSPTSAVN